MYDLLLCYIQTEIETRHLLCKENWFIYITFRKDT
jgi:hypothetical protein